MFYSKSLILDQFTPVSIYQKIQNLFTDEITFLFESVLNGNDGNFSYIIIGDRERVWHKDGKSFHKDENNNIQEIDSNPFNFLKTYYNNIDKKIYKDKAQELGIGLVDGFIGNIGYDMVQEWEPKLKNSMANLKDTIGIADFDLIRPKIILGFSHKTSKLTIVTSLDSMKDQLNIIEDELHKNFEYTPLKKAKLLNEGSFTHSKEKFFDMVAQSKEMIKSGDVFQILMTNRFTQKVEIDNLSFYRGLRSKNPSPYLFLLEYEDFCIAGSSPEVMVRLTDGKILLRPIAGTRKRGKTPKRDQEMADELISDPKERAEHIMLIDLGRNDLGRVSKAGTVKVTDLMRI